MFIPGPAQLGKEILEDGMEARDFKIQLSQSEVGFEVTIPFGNLTADRNPGCYAHSVVARGALPVYVDFSYLLV